MKRRRCQAVFVLILLCIGGVFEEAGWGAEPDSGSSNSIPRRVVCGSPAVTEIVFALGCGDRVVGVSDYSTYPPEAAAKPSIGGWINPNRERLLILRPDLILTQGKHETLSAFAEEYGIFFRTVRLDRLEDVYATVDSIAEVLCVKSRGTELANGIRNAVEAVRRTTAAVAVKRVLLLIGRTPGSLAGLSTVGPGTFLDDMITVAGGTNIFSDAKGAYPQVSKEALLIRQPESILELNPGGLPAETVDRLREDWKTMGHLTAVQQGRIVYLDKAFLLIPGPRIAQTAECLARAIHPELFGE